MSMHLEGLAGLSAFVVEDEALVALANLDILEASRCNVLRPVATAAAAIEATFRSSPAIVLMDVRLKGERTGIDAADELRGRGAMVPILFVTASSQPDSVRRMRQIPRSGILAKPLNYADGDTGPDGAAFRSGLSLGRGSSSAGRVEPPARAQNASSSRQRC